MPHLSRAERSPGPVPKAKPGPGDYCPGCGNLSAWAPDLCPECLVKKWRKNGGEA